MNFGYERTSPILRKHRFLKVKGPYFVWFEPAEWMDHDDRKDAIHRFKNPLTPADLVTSNCMIESAIDGFQEAIANKGHKYGIGGLNHFSAVIPLPSKASTTARICDILKVHCSSLTAYHNVFYKKLTQDVLLYEDEILAEERGENSLAWALWRLECMKKSHFGKPFEAKFSAMSLRRSIYNFMGLNVESLPAIQGKNILLVDDTIGEGISLREALRLLLPFSPKSVTSFTVVKDYRFPRGLIS